MDNSTNCIIICDQTDPTQPISFEAFTRALQFLEENGLLNTSAAEKPEKSAPDLNAFAQRLIELTDMAEEYREMLDSFIAQADQLLDELGGMDDDDWDDEE
ncbi:MAG: hypothetical protein PHY23_02520 [Oscillospiraceae bacterium]|nr:hypothetical protein [Oscillospiraceae bacterium]